MTRLDPDFDPIAGKLVDNTLDRRKQMTLALLVAGYTGFYLCRSNLSVCLPLILNELEANGIDRNLAKRSLGLVVSMGILAYALGKLPGGALADFFGGRRIYLGGMAGAVLFTVLFALGGSIPLFTAAWVGNRLVQSIGWPGMVKIISRWFPASSYGLAMGVVSLSYLWGDSAGRLGMGLLLASQVTWRAVFAIASGLLFGLLVINAVFLRESPGDFGLIEPSTNAANLFGKEGDNPTPIDLGGLLGPLFRSPVFWLVCLLSFGLTLLRETLNTWTATYFNEAVGLSAGRAASMSALFPLVGGFSVLLAGTLGDRLRQGGRAAILFGGMLLTGFALMVLGWVDPKASSLIPIALVSLVGFLLIGPYSYLAGAMSLDLGGKRGGATTCGIIDFVGYLGGVFSGLTIAGISVDFGWQGAFRVLAVVAWISSASAVGLWVVQKRRVVVSTAIDPEIA